MKDFMKKVLDTILKMSIEHAVYFVVMFVLSIVAIVNLGWTTGLSLLLLTSFALAAYLFDQRTADKIIRATCVDIATPQFGFISSSKIYVFYANDLRIELQIAGKKLRKGCEYNLYFGNKNGENTYCNTNFIRAKIAKSIEEERKVG